MRHTSTFAQLNPSQRQALDMRRNLAVRAGAGSGKTTVLVERTLQLLARHHDAGMALDLRHFAIVTFTRKAAAELRERLSKGCDALSATATSQEEWRWWKERIEELPRATIGTIDSLCADILRESAFLSPGEPRLEPDFQPLEGYEAGVLQREAVDRVLNRLLERSQGEKESRQAEAVHWWARTHGFATLTGHLLHLLNHPVEPAVIVAAQAGLASPAARVALLEARHPGVQKLRQEGKQLTSAINELVQALAKGTSKTKTVDKLRDRAGHLASLLAAAPPQAEQDILAGLAELLLNKDGSKSKFMNTKHLPSCLYELQEDWHESLSSAPIDSSAEVVGYEAADRLVRLLAPVAAEYAALCHQANQYDFTTIARRARDLLRHSEHVRRELHTRYRYIMVDEFQDTNYLQWEIISWLAGAGPDGPLDSDRLFVVGDPQQSIYRFRQADVSVFQHVQEHIRQSNQEHGHADQPTDCEDSGDVDQPATEEQRLGLMPLKENYRSLHPVPIEVLNRVFRDVFDLARHGHDPKLYPFETTYQDLLPGRRSAACGEVLYLMPTSEDTEESDEPEPWDADHSPSEPLSPAQVRAVVRELIRLHGQPRLDPERGAPATLVWSDMALLLPSRTAVLTALEAELRSRGVPFVTSKGIGFWQRQEVRDVVSLARWLADAGDELALFAVLRSPLGQLLDTHLLFLSQLGLGSIWRGLRQLRAHAEDFTLGPRADSHAHEHWRRLPEWIRLALHDAWQGFSDRERQRIRRTGEMADRWRQRVDRMAHADLLQSCLDDSGAQAIYAAEADGELNFANLVRVMDHVRQIEQGHALGLARLARRLTDLVDGVTREEQAALAPDEDAVQIMTVHAAKGLEFPVVAVLRMDRKLGSNLRPHLQVWPMHGSLLPEDQAGVPPGVPGVVAVQIRHPVQPRQWFKPRVFRALENLDQAQEMAEARRLFYVAATRAKERLILAGKEPRRKKDGSLFRNGQSWQRWLEEALDIQDEHRAAGLWGDAEARTQVQINRSAESGEAVQFLPEKHVLPEVDLAYRHELPNYPALSVTGPGGIEAMRSLWRTDREAWWLRHRSQLMPHVRKPLVDSRDREEAASLGTVIGTLVHRVCQMGFTDSCKHPDQLDDLLKAMAVCELDALVGEEGSRGAAASEVQAVVAAVKAIWRRLQAVDEGTAAIRALLDARGQPEVPFRLRIGGWQISGRYDKLVQRANGLEVVDWKTDADPEIQLILTRHRAQMQLYALALWRSGRAHVQADSLSVHLAMLHHMRVEVLRFPADELAAFESELSTDLKSMCRALDEGPVARLG